MPSRNPTAGGNHEIPPFSSAISIAGIRSDHTDAAIMTPDANPSSVFSSFCFISFLIKNTIAEPSTVPENGISIPNSVFLSIPFSPSVDTLVIIFTDILSYASQISFVNGFA